MVSPKQHGFTLIELLIAVAIVAILAAIAYPSYQEQIRKARRADAAAALVGLGNAMERYFTPNVTYTGAAVGGVDIGAPAIFSIKSPLDGADVFYNLTITAAGATTYALQATPVGAQALDRCGSLTLNQIARKGMIGADAGLTVDDCWR